MSKFEMGDRVDVAFVSPYLRPVAAVVNCMTYPATKHSPRLKVGDRVEVNFATDGWYAGTIVAVNAADYKIQFDSPFIHAVYVPFDAPYMRPLPAPTLNCDCGAIKAKTTHAHWCSTNGSKK